MALSFSTLSWSQPYTIEDWVAFRWQFSMSCILFFHTQLINQQPLWQQPAPTDCHHLLVTHSRAPLLQWREKEEDVLDTPMRCVYQTNAQIVSLGTIYLLVDRKWLMIAVSPNGEASMLQVEPKYCYTLYVLAGHAASIYSIQISTCPYVTDVNHLRITSAFSGMLMSSYLMGCGVLCPSFSCWEAVCMSGMSLTLPSQVTV